MTTATDAGASDWRGRIGTMDASDLANFLSQGVLCHLACLKDDGTPYVVPCWFEWDGAVFYIIPRKRSLWVNAKGNFKTRGRRAYCFVLSGAPSLPPAYFAVLAYLSTVQLIEALEIEWIYSAHWPTCRAHQASNSRAA